ncbi:LysM peptidoglycan-binding domain-containing M23 family metallopeptidase [Acinetobacter puyangensis]|uniref:LysM peptidoglycan-binding domain-containing M23 family metallopeptidase n=1 Tax=Acinetobacter puyangensis TaxID=1096779 RepID=UPI003A4D753E
MAWAAPLLMNNKSIKTILSASLLASTVLVVGCASKPTVNNSRVFYVPEFYTVQPGDSLSKIAAKYGLNYMDVARLNNIDAIDKIYVNQSLRLRDNSKSSTRLVRGTPIEPVPEIKRQSIATQAQTATVPTQTVPVQPTTPQVGLGVATAPQINPSNSTVTNSQIKWVVPSSGPIVARFDLNQNRKGLYFGGKIGDPIYAAANGEVVYADDGLTEYGKLILVRHSNGYITAYAHNSKLLVKVGDRVTSGQKIAEMGNSGATSTMLQFQIRLDGKPIDPITVLPIS